MIQFDAIYGDEAKKVTISKAPGGGEGYHVSVNKYHWGVIIYQQGKWRCYGTGIDELSTDDKDALIERVTAFENGL